MSLLPDYVDDVYRIISENLGFCRKALFPDLSAALESVIAGSRPEASQPLWLALPILVCEALGGDLEPASHLSAALELGRIAAGCLDEWQDQDTDGALWQALGAGKTVNLATALLALAQLSVSRLADLGVEPRLVSSLQREFALTLLYMSEGQHADLSGCVSLDNYAEVAAAKSGSLLRLGCRTGAMAAGAAPETVACYGEFGRELGQLAQAWNDLYGLTGSGGKRDAEHGGSLPVIAASAIAGREYVSGTPESEAGELYALTQAQLLHRQALDALARCPAPGQLGLFLDRYTIDHLRSGAVAQVCVAGENDHAA
ncbi:MAG: polyprenyl synthetase family protein [Anaerolineae bacterium]|nr:polyprenyl synthetase family protein [Anaerolineae bacterium]